MAVSGYWSLGNLAKGACQVGFDYAKNAASSVVNSVYSHITRKVEPIKEQTIACIQGNSMLSKAAKTATTAAHILAEFGKQNFTLKQISEGSGAGLAAAMTYYGGENTNVELAFVISGVSLISFIVFNFTKVGGKTGKVLEGLSLGVMLPHAILTFGGAGHAVGNFCVKHLLPAIPITLIVGTKYALETGKFMKIAPTVVELTGKAAVLAGSVKATSMIRDGMIQSPLLATAFTVTSVSIFCFCPTPNQKPKNDQEPRSQVKDALWTAGFLSALVIPHAIVSKQRSLERTYAFAASLVAGSLVGTVLPDLKDNNFWITAFRRIQYKDIRMQVQQHTLGRTFPREIMGLIHEYAYTDRRKPSKESDLDNTVALVSDLMN